MSANKRKGLRAPINIWVRNIAKNEFSLWLDEETLSGDFSFCYTTQDVSEGGLFLETDAPLPVNEQLDLELSLGPDRRVRVRALVRWVRDAEDAALAGMKPGMGLEFLNLGEADLQLLQNYLETA